MNDRQIIETTSGSIRTASLGGELLSVDELTVGFDTKRGVVHSVNGITFDLQRGKTIGIVGESGSGKSVTAKAIMGLLPPRGLQRGGRIIYEGRDISELSPAGYHELWGTEMAMVFQDPMTSLNPVMKIGQQVTESLRINLGMDRSDAKETAIQLLSAVRLPAPEKRFDEYPGQLSGGMRQRVVIAVALACGPKLLFADEPTTALDVTVQAQILDLLDEQQRDRFMGDGPRHPRPRRRGRPRRRHRRDVRRADRREGAGGIAVQQPADALHRGAAQLDPEARVSEPHASRGDRRSPARPVVARTTIPAAMSRLDCRCKSTG